MSPSEIELLVWMRDAAQTGELRRIRIESRLSLDDVASAGPVHPTTVWKWETAQRRPTSGKASLRYAQLLRKLQRELKAA
jgi:DNA-binding transcriptional regulator YiaG